MLLGRLPADGRHDAGSGLGRKRRPCLDQFDQIRVARNGIAAKCVGICVSLIGEPRFSRGIRLLFGSYPGSFPDCLRNYPPSQFDASPPIGGVGVSFWPLLQ
jgi:hypothetical protein